ncbi:MAG: MarR family transcriptional regulator [Pseudomonadota bacterium]
MRRIHAGLHPRAIRVDKEKIGPVGGMVLFAIEEMAPVSLTRLGRAVARDKSQMTRLIHLLEHKGLIVRVASDTDARTSLLSLTKAGERLVGKLRLALSEAVDDVLLALDQNERQSLERLLLKALSINEDALHLDQVSDKGPD